MFTVNYRNSQKPSVTCRVKEVRQKGCLGGPIPAVSPCRQHHFPLPSDRRGVPGIPPCGPSHLHNLYSVVPRTSVRVLLLAKYSFRNTGNNYRMAHCDLDFSQNPVYHLTTISPYWLF